MIQTDIKKFIRERALKKENFLGVCCVYLLADKSKKKKWAAKRNKKQGNG
ncbi:hypothetical protein [Paenibacillus sp. NPDC093718]